MSLHHESMITPVSMEAAFFLWIHEMAFHFSQDGQQSHSSQRTVAKGQANWLGGQGLSGLPGAPQKSEEESPVPGLQP